MVFHYTNFVIETNVWWLRRVRPVWGTGLTLSLWFIYYRYYFFGKNAAGWARSVPEELQAATAEHNKRSWGKRTQYEPTLDISLKKRLHAELGDNYKPALKNYQYFTIDDRSINELYEQETDNFEL